MYSTSESGLGFSAVPKKLSFFILAHNRARMIRFSLTSWSNRYELANGFATTLMAAQNITKGSVAKCAIPA